MLTSLLAPIVVLGQLAAAPAVPAAGAYGRCGADVAAMTRLIDRLQTAHFDLARYQAVVALRRFDVHCHPEIAPPDRGASARPRGRQGPCADRCRGAETAARSTGTEAAMRIRNLDSPPEVLDEGV